MSVHVTQLPPMTPHFAHSRPNELHTFDECEGAHRSLNKNFLYPAFTCDDGLELCKMLVLYK